jgi:hypothetical protein
LASYGGTALGNRVQVNWKGPRRWETFGLIDVVSYEKVTSSKRIALNTQIGALTWFQNSFRFEVVSEANSNNIDQDDFRFFARLTYLLWQET